MKISWSTGIIIAIISFICFIMFFVISMSTNKAYSHDLVTEEYYKQELEYQNQMNKAQNANLLSENIKTEVNSAGLEVIFPENLNFSEIKGKITLYRPSNEKLDFEVPINLESHKILLPKEKMLEGRWNIIIDWQYKAEKYFYKEEITY